jgi:hypothetical protein
MPNPLVGAVVMSRSNEQYPLAVSPFDKLRNRSKEMSEAHEEFVHWCEGLRDDEIPIDVVGYPLSTTMAILDEVTGEVIRRVSVPVYSLLESEQREPRSVTRGILIGISKRGDSISVVTSKNPNARIYNFPVSNIQHLDVSTDPGGRYVTYHAYDDGSYEIAFE